MALSTEKKYKLISDFVGFDLVGFAADRYGKEYSLVMKGELTSTLDDILNLCRHNRDGRSNLQYAQDLILGWILEDYIIERFQTSDVVFIKTGGDADRKFLVGTKVTSDSDYEVHISGNRFFVDLAHDFNLFWRNKRACHLRDNKLLNLMAKSKVAPTFLLGISIADGSCILKHIHENMNKKYILCHYAYKKPAYEIPMPLEEFYDFTDFDIRILLKYKLINDTKGFY